MFAIQMKIWNIDQKPWSVLAKNWPEVTMYHPRCPIVSHKFQLGEMHVSAKIIH